MINTLTDGEREILAELNREAEQGLEIDPNQCEECRGSGIEGILPDDTEVPCSVCGGTGEVR